MGHPAVPVEGKLVAALFFAGPGATLSHHTAAWWWGMVEERPEVIDISVPGRRRRGTGIRFHHPRELDRTWHRRLPVTTPSRTSLDLAETESIGRMRRVLAETEFLGLVDLREVEATLRRGHAGSATLRAALTRHNPLFARTRSELERRLLELCESAGLPLPEVNVMVCGFLVDAYWPEQRVVVELDGGAAHRSPARRERDYERDLVLRGVGITVCRYTWHQVTRRAALVETDLRETLERGSVAASGPLGGAAR